jgi:hypothetical protein
MNDERLISILCSQQWEKCKGELRALVSLQGSRSTQYEGNETLNSSKWRHLNTHVNSLIAAVEDNDLNC